VKGLLNIIFESENFEMVSFNWDQLVLLNKIMYLLNVLLVYVNTLKRSPKMLGM
jgi:hypothetical protein